MISSATGPPTFAASAYELCTIYKSIACEAASGHTCYNNVFYVFVYTRREARQRKTEEQKNKRNRKHRKQKQFEKGVKNRV